MRNVIKTDSIKFVEELPNYSRYSSGTKYVGIAKMLMDKRGQWADLGTAKQPTTQAAYVKGQLGVAFEVAVINKRIYARCLS